MTRAGAVLRLVWLLARRDLRSLSSLGLNNLFFCVVFLVQGSHNARTAFWSALPFLLLFLLPLLAATSLDVLARLPAARLALWPLTVQERFRVRALSLLFHPAFWLGSAALAAWAGAAAALSFAGLALAMQVLVWSGASLGRHMPGTRRWLRVPRPPGALGGVIQASVRMILGTLDFYTSLLLSVAGVVYRFWSPHPEQEAFPMIALLISLSMSTYAQQMFGLETAGSVARLRLLPLAGWQVLLAKDIAYLLIVAALVLPFSLRAGLTFALVAVAVGRYPSLRRGVRQRRWRFTGGDVRFGALQIIAGTLMATGSVRVGGWFVVGALASYGVSLAWGSRWW